jgi:hypothetical protein
MSLSQTAHDALTSSVQGLVQKQTVSTDDFYSATEHFRGLNPKGRLSTTTPPLESSWRPSPSSPDGTEHPPMSQGG